MSAIPAACVWSTALKLLILTCSFSWWGQVMLISSRHIYIRSIYRNILDGPLQLRLQTFCKSKVFPFTFHFYLLWEDEDWLFKSSRCSYACIDFHFVTLHFYLLWEDEAFLESSRCSFYQRKVFTFAPNTVCWRFPLSCSSHSTWCQRPNFLRFGNMDFFSIVLG